MASTFFFNGQLYTSPTTVSSVNDDAENPSGSTVGNTLCIVGVCDGGAPLTLYTFDDPDQVAPALISGPLCAAAIKAFNPSDELGAPGQVLAVRVGSATPSSLALNDVNAVPSVVVSAQSYGQTSAPIRMKIEAGTNAGTMKVSTAQGQNYLVQDNIGGPLFSVSYSGAQASAFIGTSGAQIQVSAPTGTSLGTMQLTRFSVVQDVVDYINSFAGFTATVLNGKGQQLVFGALDSPGGNPKTAVCNYSANLSAFLAYMNGPAQTLVTAVAAAGALNRPAPIGWTYLSGGTTPTVTLSDYTNALTFLQGVDLQWLSVLSGDASVWAAVDAHVQYMSAAGKRERRALVGPVAGTSIVAVMAEGIVLNSDRTSIVWPGYYDYDVNGNLILLDPFYTASVVAAGFAASPPGTAMTNKAFTFRGLELAVRNPADTDQLIQSGIMPVDSEATGYKVVRSISTWLVNNKFNRVEVSTGAATDYAVRTVRQALNVLRGSRSDPRLIGRAISISDTTLAGLAKAPPIGPGVIVGDTNSPAYQNITAAIDGDNLIVSFQMSPVVPNNFIGVAVSISFYSGTATSAGSAATSGTASS